MDAKEIIATLRRCTYIKHSLSYEKTDKTFIGKMSSERFDLIDASSRIGIFCVLSGTVKPGSDIQITTSLHPTFRILFMVWMAVLLTLSVFSNTPKFAWPSFLLQLLMVAIVAFIFRLCLHGVYLISRNSTLLKFKKISGNPAILLKTKE